MKKSVDNVCLKRANKVKCLGNALIVHVKRLAKKLNCFLMLKKATSQLRKYYHYLICAIKAYFRQLDIAAIQKDMRQVAIFLIGAGIFGMVLKQDQDHVSIIEGVSVIVVGLLLYMLGIANTKRLR